MCGEQDSQKLRDITVGGSSPRVRGTVQETQRQRQRIRFIPACAGNRNATAWPARLSTVHPRVCGEQLGPDDTRHYSYGSSPRVRGTGNASLVQTGCRRFIPACAGNSFAKGARQCWQPVHPRVCGEQVSQNLAIQPPCGSSPRVRGTVPDFSRDNYWIRFIPACAGNSPLQVRGLRDHPVHPRVCGEQTFGEHGIQCINGSSPRVRGTAEITSTATDQRRFIPACAGNRSQPELARLLLPVHPRVCGEQVRWGPA